MKKILLAPIAAALLCGSAFANEKASEQKKDKKGFSISSDVYYEDHEDDHFRQTKYALADSIYTLPLVNKKLELYLEGKAGMQSEEYRLENGYATTSNQKTDLYVAAEVGATYHLLDNVAVGAEVTMLENDVQQAHGQNVEMTLKYTF